MAYGDAEVADGGSWPGARRLDEGTGEEMERGRKDCALLAALMKTMREEPRVFMIRNFLSRVVILRAVREKRCGAGNHKLGKL